MEFKENLKRLRMHEGLTQAQLAEKLFVSRSTVAKWENGLDLPNPESMATLEKLFDICASELATKEPEKVIVKKNKKLWIIGKSILWSTFFVLLIAMIWLPFAIHNGGYGFTPKMVAGSYADSEYIDVGDYRIYYFSFGGAFEDGREWSDLQGFRPVKNVYGAVLFQKTTTLTRCSPRTITLLEDYTRSKERTDITTLLIRPGIIESRSPECRQFGTFPGN